MVCIVLFLLWHNNIIMLNSTVKEKPLPQLTFHTDDDRNFMSKHVMDMMTKLTCGVVLIG